MCRPGDYEDGGQIVAPIEILMVEDNADDARLVQASLDEAKIVNRLSVVSTVGAAEERLSKERRRPDLIFLDIVLNGGHRLGLELLRSDLIEGVPVVVCSAANHEDVVESVGLLGARAFIPKPITATKLLHLVNEIEELSVAVVKRVPVAGVQL